MILHRYAPAISISFACPACYATLLLPFRPSTSSSNSRANSSRNHSRLRTHFSAQHPLLRAPRPAESPTSLPLTQPSNYKFHTR